MNRTLVLPIWLPHNPKFQHYHPGAPATPSRDKWLDQVWYPFEVAMDAASIRSIVRAVPLTTFRQIASGRLDRCLAAHEDGFESYLRLSRLRCTAFSADVSSSHHRVRFLGYHLYDHGLGTREKLFAYAKPPPPIVEHALSLRSSVLRGRSYLAAHVRVTDAHWDTSDCKHSIDGEPVPSVSCGDKHRAINHTSMANELVEALRRMRSGVDGGGRAVAAAVADVTLVFLASNMNCSSDARVLAIGQVLRQHGARLVCPQQVLRERVASDNFVASLVEQEVCSRAQGFVGSKYSTWTDTVKGFRTHASMSHTYSFEELWAEGVR